MRNTTASANVLLAAPTITMQLNSTSLPETFGNNVTIGEVLSIYVYVLLPQGTTTSTAVRVSVQNAVQNGKIRDNKLTK